MTSDMKSLLFIWITLFLHTTTIAQLKDGFMFKTSICEGKNGGLLPMFGTCRGYYVCNDGKAVVGSCDGNSRFNPLTLHCDTADKVICELEDSIDNKRAEPDSSESDEQEDDSEEIKAVSVVARPAVTLKPFEQQKSHFILVKPNNENVDGLCWGRRNGIALPKVESCTEYYVCKSKKPQIRYCPGRQHFSPTRHICMKASDAKCSVSQNLLQIEEPLSSPAITAGICSDKKQDALVPHRDDCGKFMLCSNMMYLVMDCPTGLHFDAQARRCDYPKIAQCVLSKKSRKKNKKNILIKNGIKAVKL